MYFTRVTLITLTVCCSSAPVCSIVSTSRSFRNTCSSHTLTGRSLTAHHKHNIIAYLINIIIILLYCVAAVLVSCEGYTRGGFVPFVAIRSPVTRQNTLAFFWWHSRCLQCRHFVIFITPTTDSTVFIWWVESARIRGWLWTPTILTKRHTYYSFYYFTGCVNRLK